MKIFNRSSVQTISRKSSVIFFLLFGVHGIAFAQTTGAPTPDNPPPASAAVPTEVLPTEPTVPQEPAQKALGAVVVTAQRREQNIQEVPVAVTALDGRKLIDSNVIKTANDITQFIPNASSSATDGRTRPRWFLRGIGTNETAASTTSPIGIYNDDVYINNVYLQAFPLFDVERVEVLRGPQGTLWGKNTTGGAIHFLSRKPTFDTNGYARIGYGSFQEQIYQGALGGPVVGETVAARIAFYNERRNGWVDNLATGRKDGALNDTAVRAQVLFSPGGDFEALVTAKLRYLDSDSNPSFYFADPSPGQVVANPLYSFPNRGRNAIAQAGIRNDQLSSDGYSLRLNWQKAGYQVAAISAYERGRRVFFGGSAIAVDISRSRTYTYSEQLSQELRVTSPATDRFSWIAGTFLFWEGMKNSAATRRDRVPGAAGNSLTAASPGGFDLQNYEQETTSLAPFASATLRLLERLSVVGGLRYSSEKKKYETGFFQSTPTATYNNNVSQWWLPTGTSAFREPVFSNDSHTWNELTYDATLQYKINPNLNTYGRFAHGFRAGGYVISATNTFTRLEPETLNASEVGLKSQWLDRTLTINTALFNYDYKDIIVGVLLPVPGTTTTRQIQENAAEGYSRGAEVEASWFFKDRFRVQGSLGLLKTKYSNYFSEASGQTIEATGNKFTRAPEINGTLDVEYHVPLGKGSEVGVGTDWSYRSKQYFNAVNQTNPSLQQKGYAMGNARLFYRAGRLELAGYVRNVSDSLYSMLATGPANGVTRQVYGLPRTFGVTLGARF